METIKFDKQLNKLIIIDQTKLPGTEEYIELEEIEQVFDAICCLKVRGAPAIGVTAAYGLYIAANKIMCEKSSEFFIKLNEAKRYLASSRPTARNLFWALERIEKCALKNTVESVEVIKAEILKEAELIQKEDIESCKKIGEYSLGLLKSGDGVMTYCNAGALATSKYGTATAALYLGKEEGYNFKIYVNETRPLLQGARLTAFELTEAGFDVTLICDNMAASVMSKGWVNAVFVGCDCVAANGDVANKIGTAMLALAAKRYNIPFYVCAPTSTIDLNIKTGRDIIVEERGRNEITDYWYKEPMAPKSVNVFNPAFDITENDLITAIITENGIIKPGLLDKIDLEKHNLIQP